MRSLYFLYFFVVLASCRWEGLLKFNSQDEFTILQFTDMHFGEGDFKDIRTMGTQYQLINKVKPDLVVLTGDMFSGYSDKCHRDAPMQECYKKGWEQFTFALKSLKQKYAIILGNHDTQADLNAEQIVSLDMTSSYSVTKQGPKNVRAGSNYHLPIYDQQGKDVQGLLWMFDSHDEGCEGEHSPWGCVEADQIKWFNQEYQDLLQANKKEVLQSVSFVHIPPSEYVTILNEQKVQGNVGEAVCCPCQNTGIVDTMMENDVLANFSGHDHKNDYGGSYHKNGKQIELQYGRKTGYGSYGPVTGVNRGATVITLKSLGQGRISVDTYIQDESGNRIMKRKAEKQEQKMRPCPC